MMDAISRPSRPVLSPKPYSIHIPSTKYYLPAQMRQFTFFSNVGAELIGAWDFLKRVQGSDVKVALGKELTR